MATGRDSIRYWAGAVGAAAMVAGIVSVVVMVQMQKPTKTKAAAPQRTAAAPQPRPASAPPAWTVAAAQQPKPVAATQQPKPVAAAQQSRPAAEPRTVASIQATPKAQPAPKTQPEPKKMAPAATALSDAERKLSEELWVEQKRLDTDGAKLAEKADGRRRMTAMIAKQYNVQEKLVSDLRDRKLGYGEITASLAFSQQLMKRDKSTRQQALDRVLAARKSGQGWAAFARGAGLKIGDVLDDVRKTDKQFVKAIG
jgi:hypothetical protein